MSTLRCLPALLLLLLAAPACGPAPECPADSAVTWEFQRNSLATDVTPHIDACGRRDTVTATMAAGGVLIMHREFPRRTSSTIRLFVNAQPACTTGFKLTVNNHDDDFVTDRTAFLYSDVDVDDAGVYATVTASTTVGCGLFMGAGVAYVSN